MNIKQLRKELKLSQEEFANMVNVPIGTIRNWEQGRNTMPEYVERMFNNEIHANYKININTIKFINMLNKLAKLSLNGYKEWAKASQEDVYSCIVYNPNSNNRIVMDANTTPKKRQIISYYDGFYKDKNKANWDAYVVKEKKNYTIIVLLREEKVSFIINNGEWEIAGGVL